MGSIIKMFKTNKKHGNKENMPTVSFNTSSLKKSTKPALTDFVYTGEPTKNVDLRLKSPYNVVTAPKTTRGPRSCPGAPMDDNYEPSKKLNASMLVDRKNVMRIDNPREKEKRRVKDDSELIQQRRKSSEFMNGRMSSDEIAYRNMLARQQYDVNNTYESDEDEVYEARIRSIESRNAHLESKMQKMHRRMNEERNTMTRQIEILQEENYRLKKSHDRMHRQYSQMKTQIEVERKQKSDLLKMLHDANNKIDMLEAGCEENENDESVNTSSLLLPYTGGNYQNVVDMERSSEGAGEALCFPESLTISSSSQPFGVYGNMGQTLIVNPMPNSMKDDMDTHDEVRIFRTGAESSDGESSPVELSRKGMERMNVKHSSMNSGEVTRSHSDSDLMVIPSPRRASVAEIEKPRSGHKHEDIEKPERTHYSRHSAWLKKNSKMDDDLSTSSSEEERMSLIDRQLKKKGGLVKFNPPRPTIQAKHYKRFGKMERTALAEFEYLQDMSTDVSGMMSSPEVNQLTGMSISLPPRT